MDIKVYRFSSDTDSTLSAIHIDGKFGSYVSVQSPALCIQRKQPSKTEIHKGGLIKTFFVSWKKADMDECVCLLLQGWR